MERIIKKVARAMMVREMRAMERAIERLPRTPNGYLIVSDDQIEHLSQTYAHVYRLYRSLGGTCSPERIELTRVVPEA